MDYAKIVKEIEKRNEQTEREKKLKRFLLNLGKTGEIADKVSDLILFHNRVRENADKRYM